MLMAKYTLATSFPATNMKLLSQIKNHFNRILHLSKLAECIEVYLANHKWELKLKYINTKYRDIIDSFQSPSESNLESVDLSSTCPIWVMWWQGEENMPPLVKACYESLKANKNNHPIHLITQNNFSKYLEESSIWDNEAIDFVKNGVITITFLSDLIRTSLLHTYGGLWIDSTMYVCQPIDKLIGTNAFLTGKRKDIPVNRSKSKGLSTSYLIGGGRKLLYEFIYDLLLTSIKREGKIIEYFLIDYAFFTAYMMIPTIKSDVDKAKFFPDKFWLLNSEMNNEFNESRLIQLKKEMPCYKLDNKTQFQLSTPDGKPTFYYFIIHEFN